MKKNKGKAKTLKTKRKLTNSLLKKMKHRESTRRDKLRNTFKKRKKERIKKYKTLKKEVPKSVFKEFREGASVPFFDKKDLFLKFQTNEWYKKLEEDLEEEKKRREEEKTLIGKTLKTLNDVIETITSQMF